MGRFYSWKREFGLNKFQGSVFFPCYKEPRNQVTFLDCENCPWGLFADWQNSGWPECKIKLQQDQQHLKELEQKEEQEKREFQEFLRQNAEENEWMRRQQEDELRQDEPRRQRVLRGVEEAMREPYKVSLWPAKKDQIDWNRVHGIEQDKDEEEPSDEEDGDGGG